MMQGVEYKVTDKTNQVAKAWRGCGDLHPNLSATPNKLPIPLTGISPSPLGGLESESGPGARLPARLWGHIKRGAHALDDHWIGDLIGVLCLFVIPYVLLVFGWAMS